MKRTEQKWILFEWLKREEQKSVSFSFLFRTKWLLSEKKFFGTFERKFMLQIVSPVFGHGHSSEKERRSISINYKYSNRSSDTSSLLTLFSRFTDKERTRLLPPRAIRTFSLLPVLSDNKFLTPLSCPRCATDVTNHLSSSPFNCLRIWSSPLPHSLLKVINKTIN